MKCPIHGVPMTDLIFRSVCDFCDPPSFIYKPDTSIKNRSSWPYSGYIFYTNDDIRFMKGEAKDGPGLWAYGSFYPTIVHAENAVSNNNQMLYSDSNLYQVVADWNIHDPVLRRSRIMLLEQDQDKFKNAITIGAFRYQQVDGYALVLETPIPFTRP